jgi:serine O-acetyltransferase
MSRDPDLAKDFLRYPKRPLWREQSAWALMVYRWGRRMDAKKHGLWWKFQNALYWPMYRLMETVTGISLPKTAKIGPGLRIFHFGNIFVHGNATMGANCTLRQGVTIGNLGSGPVPVIEDDVEFGAYAQVLGGVKVGKGAKIGSMSVVISDVPAGATAFGVPARVLAVKDPSANSPVSPIVTPPPAPAAAPLITPPPPAATMQTAQ